MTKKYDSYSHKFMTHVEKFMDKHELWPKSRIVVALSGGADSVGLLVCLNILASKRKLAICALHIDHGLRKSSADDLQWCKELCGNLGIDFFSYKIFKKFESNKEHEMRHERYRLFESFALKGDRLFLGHHLNDSFEWSLLKSFKSSEDELDLGIPLTRGIYTRPFHCVSKRQILKFLECQKISFLLDETNLDTNYERNYIRVMIEDIEKKFPSYLKHYVFKQNKKIEFLRKYSFRKDFFGGISVNPKANSKALIKAIKLVSNTKRGSLFNEVEKMIHSRQTGRKGPFCLSGDVLGFVEKNFYYFISRDDFENRKRKLQKKNESQIPVLGFNNPSQFSSYLRHVQRISLTVPILITNTSPKGCHLNIQHHPIYRDWQSLSDSSDYVFNCATEMTKQIHRIKYPLKILDLSQMLI